MDYSGLTPRTLDAATTMTFIDPYWNSVALEALVTAITVTGLYISNSAGSLSVAHAALAGISGYIAAILTTNFGLPFVPAVLAGACGAALSGALLSLLTSRMNLLVAGLATLAYGETAEVIAYNISYIGGSDSFYGIPLETTFGAALFTLACALFVAWRFDVSRIGRAALAVRDDPVAAAASGIRINYVRFVSFVLGAFVAGVGGALRVHYVLVVNPADLGFTFSLPLVIMWVVGGSYVFWGAALAAIALTFIPEFLRFSTDLRFVLYGLLLAVIILRRPAGLIPRIPMGAVGRYVRRYFPGEPKPGRPVRAAAGGPTSSTPYQQDADTDVG
jgi:branched-chain amino acid transport system permease protein